MRFQIFLSGLLIIAMGLAANRFMEKAQAMGFLSAAAVLGGSFLICGAFSLQNRWLGFMAAGVMALLGAAQGVANVKHFISFLQGDRSRDLSPLLEMSVMLICVILVIRVYQFIKAERLRKMLEEEDEVKP